MYKITINSSHFKACLRILLVIYSLVFQQSYIFSENHLKSYSFYSTIKVTPNLDSISLSNDSLSNDSILVDTLISPDALESKVSYKANDSIRFDLANQKVYLFGKAEVTYEDLVLTAAAIEIRIDSSQVFAYGIYDSTGKYTDRPLFSQGEQNFSAYSIRYNFKTKKGKIVDVITQEGESYIHGQHVKRMDTEELYIKNGKYTTCNLEHPHFYIYASKLKVIPDDKIVTGPAYMVIEDVPTPLAVPFGLFPNKKERSSGILIPTYGESPSLGFYLMNGGYYWTISDRMDLALTGDIYSKGSYGLKANTQYYTRYKYSGNFSFSYSQIRNSYKEFSDFSKQNEFFVRWNHAQDAKARPNSRFSADVNAGTTTNFKNNLNSITDDYLTNTFSSNISYIKSFPNKPFSLTLSARHNQNTQTRQVNVSLPDAAFNVQRLFPFRGNNTSSKGQWYKNAGISYSANMRNDISTYDTLIKLDRLDRLTNDMKNGVQHTIPLTTSFKVFKFFTMNPAINLQEKWYAKTVSKTYDSTLNLITTDTVYGFARGSTANASSNLTFKLYGMYLFKGNTIKAIRHVFTPSVGFSYTPENNAGLKKYYNHSLQKEVEYSVFEGGIFGTAHTKEAGLLNLNLINNLEMKVRSKKDSIKQEKKIVLFENLGISTAYDAIADSLNWQDIKINGRTYLFKNLNLNFNGNITPYRNNILGQKINETYWDFENSIGRLNSANVTTSFSLRSKDSKKSGLDKAKSRETDNAVTRDIKQNPQAYIDFNVPWSINVNYNLAYNKPNSFQKATITNTIGLNGDLNITPKWKVGYQTNYDIEEGKFSYTSFDIYRDLHCWEMSISWVPFGQRKSYMVKINVKASTLQDLKITRKREYYDFDSSSLNQ